MYRKNLFVFYNDQPVAAVVRNYTIHDFSSMSQIQQESFPPPFPQDLLWNEEQLTNHTNLFPEGALCLEINGELAGSITSLLVDLDDINTDHTWNEMTDQGYIRNHSSQGKTLYIVDFSVRPKYRQHGVGKWLMMSMYDVVIQKKIHRLLGGGRMPGYHKVAHRYSPEEYLQAIVTGKEKDPVISFLLRCGRVPVKVVNHYIEDEESLNHAVMMEWRNPFMA